MIVDREDIAEWPEIILIQIFINYVYIYYKYKPFSF